MPKIELICAYSITLYSYVLLTTGTLVLIRLRKKQIDLMSIKQKTERFVWTKISFDLGKNGCHRHSDLGGRLIVVVRHLVSETKH